MFPELFEIPYTDLTVKGYGLMMVIGFLLAVTLIRRLSRDITPDPQYITNAALYSLIAGVVGARIFYVVHYFYKFKDNLLSVFAIWQGGLELLGGVILAITVIFLYLRHHKLPVRRYLDILAVALMVALAFGRIGCFLNGCCFGKPTNLPWAVRFPYASPAYHSQVTPNHTRNRPEPQLQLTPDFFAYAEENGVWYSKLKIYKDLTPQQKDMVDKGPYRTLPVHPTQLYSSANGIFLCLILFLFWRRSHKAITSKTAAKPLVKPGCVFALMLIFYALTRFLLEFLRDDNPIGFAGLTISQRIGIFGLIPIGLILIIAFEKIKPQKAALNPPD